MCCAAMTLVNKVSLVRAKDCSDSLPIEARVGGGAAVVSSSNEIGTSDREGITMGEGASNDKLLHSAEQVLIHKLMDTSQAVVASTSPETSIVYCRLVCSLGDAIRSVHQLRDDLKQTNP